MMRVYHREADLENHDRGLDYDLPRLLHRRGMLKLVAGAGLAGTGLITLAACGDPTRATPQVRHRTVDQAVGQAAASRRWRRGATESGETSDTANGELPEETAGPYPGRRLQRRERADRERRRAQRHHLQLRVQHHQGRRHPADRHHDHQRLRQRQAAARRCARSTCGTATGPASTRSTPRGSPGRTTCAACRRPTTRARSSSPPSSRRCYDGRWPHIHFEVYPSLAKATNSANKIATSQMALPEDTAKAVYATAGYEQSVQQPQQGQPGQRQRLRRRLRPADPHHDRRPHQRATPSPSPARSNRPSSRALSLSKGKCRSFDKLRTRFATFANCVRAE